MANIKVKVIDGIVDGISAGNEVTIDEVHVERLVKAGFIAQPEEAEAETEAPAKKATTKKKAE
ncbi:hypothetical protein HB904_04590 [Listeria booriae]|uniref:Uncharacterized protein n=1 Tax=Listeria booriae TaxID=1552123 RepID=A0A842AGR1_9LIST|nr:hypothetical protein [Listeria booriae]MBC1615450.1 hypothetical protein [Listeria booriae]